MEQIILLDGAIGSYLEESIPSLQSEATWMTAVNESNPDTLTALYKAYLDSGSNTLTSNTFRTSPINFEMNYKQSDAAVAAAMQVVKPLGAQVAGSNGPAEDSYTSTRLLNYEAIRDSHYAHIDSLVSHGADFILNETIGDIREAEIVSKKCFSANIPFVTSVIFSPSLSLPICNTPVQEALKHIDSFNPICTAVNCVNPGTFSKLAETFDFSSLKNGFGLYLNCGDEDFERNDRSKYVSPSDLVSILEKLPLPRLIGACCMSGPAHIQAICDYLSYF